jgi:hypothetical protein
MSVPTFQVAHEQWYECWVCGFDYPLSTATRHYRSNRLVCMRCDDQKNNSDFLMDMVLPSQAEADRRRVPDQPATCQGEVTGTRWYEGRYYEGKWYDPGDNDCSGRNLGDSPIDPPPPLPIGPR